MRTLTSAWCDTATTATGEESAIRRFAAEYGHANTDFRHSHIGLQPRQRRGSEIQVCSKKGTDRAQNTILSLEATNDLQRDDCCILRLRISKEHLTSMTTHYRR